MDLIAGLRPLPPAIYLLITDLEGRVGLRVISPAGNAWQGWDRESGRHRHGEKPNPTLFPKTLLAKATVKFSDAQALQYFPWTFCQNKAERPLAHLLHQFLQLQRKLWPKAKKKKNWL